MKIFGFAKFSEFLRICGLPGPERMPIDTMHAVFLGALKKHFMRMMKLLVTGDMVNRNSVKNVWAQLGDEFSSYCRINQIRCSVKFQTRNQFRRFMKAAAMKHFAAVSPFLLLKVFSYRSLASNVGSSKYTAFKYWCLHVRVAQYVDKRELTCAELELLRSDIEVLMKYFNSKLGEKFVSINIHYYTHLVNQIKQLGPCKIAANFFRESLIQCLKRFFRNSNFKSTEHGVFQRYVSGLFYLLFDFLEHGSNDISFTRYFYSVLVFNLTHNYRDALPVGTVPFDLSGFEEVCVDYGEGESRTFTQNDINECIFMFDPRKSGAKVNYVLLRPNNILKFDSTPFFPVEHFGVFKGLFTSRDGEHFVAYHHLVAVEQEVNLFFKKISIPGEVTETTLYVVPVMNLLTKVNVYGKQSVVEFIK
jgi:hypothetical protein